jgi:hypothetical protein
MKLSPEEPQTVNAQLRQLPAYQAILAPEPLVAAPSIASRVVAALMQLKDTAAILLLLSDGSLIFGIICLFGIPGLVLYGLRWRQVRGRAGRKAIMTQAVLSLLHESLCVSAFHGEKASTDGPAYPEVLTVLYGLGAVLSFVQLVVALGDEEHPVSFPDEQQAG